LKNRSKKEPHAERVAESDEYLEYIVRRCVSGVFIIETGFSERSPLKQFIATTLSL
jgi:hypothetical protein